MIYRLPDSLQQAKLLVGTRLQVWVQPEEDQPGRWHPAKIVQASYELGDGGDPINLGRHFLMRSVHHTQSIDSPLLQGACVNIWCFCPCRYDGAEEDTEHISFAEVFNGVTSQGESAVRVVKMPAEARRLLEDLRRKTSAGPHITALCSQCDAEAPPEALSNR